jgi:hypothetical protein
MKMKSLYLIDVRMLSYGTRIGSEQSPAHPSVHRVLRIQRVSNAWAMWSRINANWAGPSKVHVKMIGVWS